MVYMTKYVKSQSKLNIFEQRNKLCEIVVLFNGNLVSNHCSLFQDLLPNFYYSVRVTEILSCDRCDCLQLFHLRFLVLLEKRDNLLI